MANTDGAAAPTENEPAPGATSGEDAAALEDSYNFAGEADVESFSDDVVQNDDVVPAPAPAGVTPAAPAATTPAAPVAAPVAAPAPAAQPVAPAPQPTTPQAPAPAEAAPATPAPEPGSLDEALTMFDSARGPVEEALGAHNFVMTPEDMELFHADPAVFLQRAGGRLLYVAQRAAMAAMQKWVPQMAERHITQTAVTRERATKGEAAFRTAWPDITKEHDPLVRQAQIAHKGAYPNATPAERIDGVGRIVMAMLGRPIAPKPAAAAAAPSPAKPRAFVPASVGVEMPTAETPESPWDAFVNYSGDEE